MAADSDNEMRDFTDSEGEQERWEEKTGTRAGIGLIKVQAVLRTEHLRKGYLPVKCRTTEKKTSIVFFYPQKLINILRVAHYHHFRTEI